MERADAADVRRARAAMCSVCPEAVRDGPWFTREGSPLACGLSGKPIKLHVESCRPSCPAGHHPGASGMVHWVGLDWFGVPYPVRLWLRRKLTAPLPGCGCIARLKIAWERLKARWAGNAP